ncbi:MAG: hypothetical protein OXN83_03645 [Oligoflexia bacterium]|nr:hypothetical protein [Oligoflexia bacterium]
MKTFRPSKTLNIKSNFFGLTLDDLLGLMIFYTLFQFLFSLIGLDILSIVLTFLLSFFLIPIRLKFRRGIIKDYFVFLSERILKGNLI